MSKMEVIKKFFGDKREVSNAEILALRKADPAGYDKIAEDAAKSLGVELSQ